MTGPLDRLLRTRPVRTIATGTAFLLFFFYGSFQAWVVLPLARLWARLRGASRAELNRLSRRIVGGSWRFFHGYMRWLRLIDYDPRQVGATLPDGPFVLIANHPTLIDVTALVAFHPDTACVAKTGMFNNPALGPLLRACEHIDGGNGGLFSGAAVVSAGIQRLEAGIPVLIFPEGTRSPERGLGAFRQGAYEMAERAGVPLVEMVVTCDPPTLMRGQAWYEIPPHTATLRVGLLAIQKPPFTQDARQLMLESQRRYREHLEKIGAIGPREATQTQQPQSQPTEDQQVA
jgi:1-acyl-sn-glycerol-3-phosphate acyltransferase